MEDTFNSAAVKTRVLNRVGLEARWCKYHLPILIGNLGALALLALYLTIMTVAQGWHHAVELFQLDAWLVIPIMVGFGVEVALYTYLRGVMRRGSCRSKMMMGAWGGTLSFPAVKNRGQSLTLTLRGIANVPESTSTWKVNG